MVNPVLQILQRQLIPWVEQFGLSQIIVARGSLAAMRPRLGFDYSPRQLLGPRRGVRSFTFSGNTARWPRDHLIESSSPLLTFILEGNADMRFRDYWLHTREGQGVFALADIPRKAGGSVTYLHPDRRPDDHCSTINFSEVRGYLHVWVNRSRGKIHETLADTSIYTLDDRAIQLLRQMQFHFIRESSDDNPICLYLLKAFLLTLRDDLQMKRFVQTGLLHESKRRENQGYDPVNVAREYIRTHLHEPLTLQNVARQVRMTRTQFALLFKRETGQTFNQFVTACRMEQAKVLLRETDYTLRFVRSQIGYQSLAHFNKVFLKTQEMTPRQYREKYHRNIENENEHP